MKSPTEGGGGEAWLAVKPKGGVPLPQGDSNSMNSCLVETEESVEPTLWAMAFPRERVGWRWSPLPDPPEPLP